jgi:hypothetical protein
MSLTEKILQDKHCFVPCPKDQCDCVAGNSADLVGTMYTDLKFEDSKIDFTKPDNQDLLKRILTEGSIEIVFTKVNGERRVMRSTLKPEYLPKVEIKEGEEVKPKKEFVPSPLTLRVFDMEKQDWRSLRWDSITAINIGG